MDVGLFTDEGQAPNEASNGALAGRFDDYESDLFKRALIDVLRSVPYNSASQFIGLSPTSNPDPALGVACVLQNFEIAKHVDSNAGPEPLYLSDGRHIAPIFEYEDGLVLLDPYLLHFNPVRISSEDVRRGSARIESPAAPVRLDRLGNVRPARLVVRYRGLDAGYIIRLDYLKFSPTLDRYFSARTFTLNSWDASKIDHAGFSIREVPLSILRTVLTDPEQTSLSIRALSGDLLTMSEAILPLAGYATRKFDERDVWVRNTQGEVSNQSEAAAGRVWDELESATGTARPAIIAHLLEAAEVYQSLAEPATDVAPYSLKDE